MTRNDPQRSRGTSPARKGDEGTVGPGEAGTGDLAAEHSQLVAQNKDLCILGRSIRPVDANDLEHVSEQTVEEGQGHDGSLTEGVLAGQTRSEGFWTLQVIAFSDTTGRSCALASPVLPSYVPGPA